MLDLLLKIDCDIQQTDIKLVIYFGIESLFSLNRNVNVERTVVKSISSICSK